MAHHDVKRLPVIEEDGTLVGIVARADVVRHVEAGAAESVLRVNLGTSALFLCAHHLRRARPASYSADPVECGARVGRSPAE